MSLTQARDALLEAALKWETGTFARWRETKALIYATRDYRLALAAQSAKPEEHPAGCVCVECEMAVSP